MRILFFILLSLNINAQTININGSGTTIKINGTGTTLPINPAVEGAMAFIEASETNYVAFGNLIHLEGDEYAWSGRRGGNHLGNGRIYTLPYNATTKTVGTPVVISRTIGEDLRGGAHCVINGQIYFFSSLYMTGTNTFVSLTLNKSTDLTGTSWTESTLLYTVGTNGGVNETTYDRFNFYGTPVNIPGTQKWFVPWFEHNNSVEWRVNYLYSDDDFATWTTVNISDGTADPIGEAAMVHLGGDTLLVMGRVDGNVPMRQNVSYDLGATWEGWTVTNLGSSLGRVMPALLNSTEHGLIVIYGDRGTGTIKISLNNTIADIIADATAYNAGVTIHTVAAGDDYQPLAYPSILRISENRFLIAFSEHLASDTDTKLFIGDGSLENY